MEERYEAPLWHFVADWPQVPSHIRHSLDADLIPLHAVAALRRSLDTGRVMAFLGSGVSMAYGRLGWGEMLRWMDNACQGPAEADTRAKHAMRLLHANPAREGSRAQPLGEQRMRSLLKALDINRPSTGDDLQTGRYPAAFQFLERMAVELESPGRARSTPSESRVRGAVRALLRDDAGHAYLLLDKLYADLFRRGAPYGPSDLGPELEPLNRCWAELHACIEASIEQKPDACAPPEAAQPRQPVWRSTYTLSMAQVKKLGDALKSHGPARQVCEGLVSAVCPGQEDHALAPLHRFVVPAMVRIAPAEACRLLLAATNAQAEPKLTHRRRAVTEGRDPLLVLLRDFGIKRFATTNYDLDIEQIIRDRGFDASGTDTRGAARGSRTLLRNALGMAAHHAAFRREHAAELLRFATDHSGSIQVMHLHGRVLPSEPLVITESDYQTMYLQRGDAAEAARDAIALAFRGNTVLYVGSGMSEDDILRPLRQFVTERKSTADRSGIVLLPADGSRAREVEEIIALYSRYGVLTKHFGLGELEPTPPNAGAVGHPPPPSAGSNEPKLRWLSGLLATCRHLKELLAAVDASLADTAGGAGDGGWHPLRERLRQGPAFARESGDASLQPTTLPWSINGCAVSELLPALGSATDFSQLAEVAMLRTVAQALIDLLLPDDAQSPDWLRPLGVATTRDRAWSIEQSVAEGSATEVRRLAQGLVAVLDGLGSAMRGLAMVLELASLHAGWLAWKRRRAEVPHVRPVGAHRVGSVVKTMPHTMIFQRNLLALRPAYGAGAAVARQAGDRFVTNAPSQSFQALKAALANRPPSPAIRNAATNAAEPMVGSGARRLFLLLARRGAGKGHFFEMMAEPERVKSFIECSWQGQLGADGGNGRPPPRYAACAYVNLGLSLEFLSAFDRLSLVLVERAPIVFPDEPGREQDNVAWQIRRASDALANNRLACLQTILGLYAHHHKRARARVLIAFNGFGQFFDRHGAPKNAQLHRLIEALIGKAAAKVPIDVLVVCQDTDIPGCFKAEGLRLPITDNQELDGWSGTSAHAIATLLEPDPSERVRNKLKSFLEAHDVKVVTPTAGHGEWLHVLRGALASATVSKYFPDVALALAIDATAGVHGRADAAPRAFVTTPQEMEQIQIKTLKELRKHGASTRPPVGAARTESDAMEMRRVPLRKLAMLATRAIGESAGKTGAKARLIARSGEKHKGLLGLDRPGLSRQELGAIPKDRDRLEACMTATDKRFQQLHRQLHGSRYLLTIVCAAASERGWLRKGLDEWHLVPRQVVQWLEEVRLGASNHLSGDAIDRFIGKVLNAHQDSHDRCCVPPGWQLMHAPAPSPPLERLVASIRKLQLRVGSRPGGSSSAPADDAATIEQISRVVCGPLGWRLQQRLMWHLAVMSLEVQADVLATAPLVEADCLLLLADVIGKDAAKLRVDDLRRLGIAQHLVALVLDLLVHRCLVFRMGPVELGPEEVRALRSGDAVGPKFDSWYRDTYCTAADKSNAALRKPDTGWRYTIHRYLQRHILGHLKAPFVEFQRVDQFGLSLWASLPDELPRPHRSAAHDISDLVAAWIGFPMNAEGIRATSTYHWYAKRAQDQAKGLCEATTGSGWNDADPWLAITLPSRMLRAALGVLRATYSVGVVSRLHDPDSEATGLSGPEEGYFKQHHLQVRWLLEQARNLKTDEYLSKLLGEIRGHPERGAYWGLAMEAAAPFYVDELVWLNNECGLFCLVEGRLDNAAGMFRQALIAATQVEGEDPRGALSCRVHLNLAVVDIERGRIREADEQLAQIEAVRDENPILRILARGFRALVQHLSGNLSRAEMMYAAVISDLGRLGQLRSVAIFSRHLAELHRLQGASKSVEALRAIEQSIAAATKGGHEDIRHLAMLSRVRLAIAGVLPPEVLGAARESIQPDLDAIERYGQVMGMSRLLADAAFARALRLLGLGETRHAAHLVHQCLELCAINGLRLRQMMGMALLGRIYRKRGRLDLAEPLFAQAYALATDCHYGNLREVAIDGRTELPTGP